jgi:hypothetical protein
LPGQQPGFDAGLTHASLPQVQQTVFLWTDPKFFRLIFQPLVYPTY